MAIEIRGAGEHNLKSIDLEISDGITVVTGVSGSGKSSLVFDTLYRESRRRYLEAFGRLSAVSDLVPAKVDSITGLGPAIVIGQNLLNRNPQSTVASAAGLHPLFRLLWSRFGTRRCPDCGTLLDLTTEDDTVEGIYRKSRTERVDIWLPLLRAIPGSHRTLLSLLTSEYAGETLKIDGVTRGQLPDGDRLDPRRPHSIEMQIGSFDRSSSRPKIRAAVREAISRGADWIMTGGAPSGTHRGTDGGQVFVFSPVCRECGRWFAELEPRHFRTPCPECGGGGGADRCGACGGTGLWPDAASTTWSGLGIKALLGMPVTGAHEVFARKTVRGGRLISEIFKRLEALYRVGLGYVQLDRPVPSLSRGEAQRLRLSLSLTSRLDDMLHILDEPTVGQHPHDVRRLLRVFRDLPGPVVFVEHDRIAASHADQAVDLGPGAGDEGGRVTFTGTTAGLFLSNTATGRYFSLRERPHRPARPEFLSGALIFEGASLRTLKNIDITIPVGCVTALTGVSGSGKSTLMEKVIFETLKTKEPSGCAGFKVVGVDKVPVPVLVDQSPIGLNPRSNPATYTKLADRLRVIFAKKSGLSPSFFSFNRKEGACPVCGGLGAVEVRMRYLPSTWLKCSSCLGRRFVDEVIDVRIDLGGRFVSIDEVFDSTVSELASLFERADHTDSPTAEGTLRTLRLLEEVGLGYLRIGQPSPSLSGGEAQRIKLVKFLSRKRLDGTAVLLDEPSTGLHPADTGALITLLARFAEAGATVIVIEHNTDIIRAADRVIDLGPGAGDEGGRVVFAGPPSLIKSCKASLTGRALAEEDERSDGGPPLHPSAPREERKNEIIIRDAGIHNLKGVNVAIPKRSLTVVTGLSGSGKSSLVVDVLEAEARRRFLESLSFYERQSVRETAGPQTGEVTGLGVTHTMGSGNLRLSPRTDCGTLTGLAQVLAVLFAAAGERPCPACGTPMGRVSGGFQCKVCGNARDPDRPEYFSPSTYVSACTVCHGVGTMQVPSPSKLITHPQLPICGGAMHSPGFFPKGYLCKPFNGGYYLVQALAARFGFDPASTPWAEMSEEARNAFLYGCAEPLEVHYENRKGLKRTSLQRFPGFYGWIRDWDVGGTYTSTEPCPSCGGTRLRQEYLEVKLAGLNIHEWRSIPLKRFIEKLAEVTPAGPAGADRSDTVENFDGAIARRGVRTGLARVRFLESVGLGYLNLNQPASTLSAGEAQRLRLAGLLGGDMSALSVILDEPTRGMHPAEVDGLIHALEALRDQGNTVIVIEHELDVIRAADFVIELGPGPGRHGGKIEYAGSPGGIPVTTATGRWLAGRAAVTPPARGSAPLSPTRPTVWAVITGAAGNNLKHINARFPRGCITGVCGVSGSGKSTLVVDTIGRALAPKKHTTSVSSEPLEPYPFAEMTGFPEKCSIVDQTKTGMINPADFLGVERVFRKIYAESDACRAAGLGEKELVKRCTACGGRGYLKTDLAFLPAVITPCEVCGETGYTGDVLDLRVRGRNLAELHELTIDEVLALWGDEVKVRLPLERAVSVGLGYLLLRQPGYALSGGEAQRLKIAKELADTYLKETLYILDEPTFGLHMEDLSRLLRALRRLSESGHTIIVVEHHAAFLAACDWLIELGPGGGPDGGNVIASCPPSELSTCGTPSAKYLKRAFETSPFGRET